MAHPTHERPKLFVSYARDDRELVYPEVDWLRSIGFDAHIDRHITPGVKWREAVAESISDSDLLLFYASPSSADSQFCAQEVQFALDRKVPVITVMITPTELPGWMQFSLGDHQILHRFDQSRRAYRALLESGLRHQLGEHILAAPLLEHRQPEKRSLSALFSITAIVLLTLIAYFWWSRPPPPSIAAATFDTDGSAETPEIGARIGADLTQGLVGLHLLPVQTLLAMGNSESEATHRILGSIQRIDGGYRIRTALVQSQGNRELWGQSFTYLDSDTDRISRQHVNNILRALPDLITGTIPHLDRSTAQSRETAARLYEAGQLVLSNPVEKHDLARAGQLFEQALDSYPGYAAALLGLCEALLRNYDETRVVDLLVEAETRCLQALTLGGANVPTLLTLGRVYLFKGDLRIARTHFQRASTLAPENPDTWVGLASVADANGESHLALEYFQRATDLPAAGWQAHIALGNHYFMKGDFEAAVDHYESVVELHPEAPAAYTNLGAAWYKLGKIESATAAWRSATKLEPNPMSWANLGAAYTYLEDYPAALEAYRNAAEMAPGDHRWLGHIGEIMIYASLGDTAAAKQTIQRALELATAELEYARTDAAILARVSTYEALLGSRQEALGHAAGARQVDERDLQAAYSILQTYTLLNETALVSRERARLIGLGYPEMLLSRDPWLN